MDALKIRVTLTNTKGWKETRSISLANYLSQKEKGSDAVDTIIQDLIKEYQDMGNKTEDKDKDISWRP